MLSMRSSLWVLAVCASCVCAGKHKKTPNEVKQYFAETHSHTSEKQSLPRWTEKEEESKREMSDDVEMQPMIVGGRQVSAGFFPFIASLYIADPNCGAGVRRPHFCGGSIFDTTTDEKSWVLTAAHCLVDLQSAIDYYDYLYRGYECEFALYADIGRDDADDAEECGFPTLKMEGWKIHAYYDAEAGTSPYDVAIAWSKNRVAIRPVLLQLSSPCCYNEQPVRVIGYGADILNGLPTETLEYVDLKYLEFETCAAMFDPGLVQPGMVCAIDENESACHGDSGGPLLRYLSDDTWIKVQVGVVSWGYGCDEFAKPSVFADVGFHYDWIMSTKSAVAGAEYFTCDDFCLIPAAFVDDDFCDCSECEDESNWDCDSCRCPAFCGFFQNCRVFLCNDGCVIPDYYEDNGYCDCSECEDEPNWSCETCPGCPQICHDWVECGRFECNNGCTIPGNYVDDDWCDCGECEDESYWSCYSCPDCPQSCGEFVECGFVCDDGCHIRNWYYEDNWCDCSNCEDEPNWTCDSCFNRCPTECREYKYCLGDLSIPTVPGFLCDDGCEIAGDYCDDDWCDCNKCEDEHNWDCESCAGGCPTICGGYEYCDATNATTTTTTETPTSLPTPAQTCERTMDKLESFTFSSDEANCFSSIDEQLPGTGWTQSIGPLAVGQSVALYTISGAEDCQLTDARCDGLVTATRRVDANGDFLEVAFAGNEANGVRFTKYFVWFGTSQLPLKNNGQPTINSNAFFCKDHTPGVGSVNHSLQCRSPDADFSFDDAFHFIAHSLTTGCHPTEVGQSFCAAIFE